MKKHTRNITLALLTAATVSTSHGAILALYDAQIGANGNFNTTAFDSVDSDGDTTATRLSQGGSLTGGGAANFILDNDIFSTSDSGKSGFNFAGVNTASRADADTAGDTFSFTLEAGGNNVTYESLSFFANQFDIGAKVDISYAIGASETFISTGLTPAEGSGDVNFKVAASGVDFTDFSSTEDVTFTFYLYDASASNFGTRFDDIILNGTVSAVPEPSSTALLGLGGLTLILRRRRA